MNTIAELVTAALNHGSLFAAGYGKTITVNGKRRHTIRLQFDIFGDYYAAGSAVRYYPDLWPALHSAVSDFKAANR